MKKRMLFTGIIAIASPIPMIIFTILWSWVLSFGIIMGLLGYSEIPDWGVNLGLLPLTFSPLFEIFGITLGIVKFKERFSVLCIILSILGLFINFALLFTMGYLGSRY